MRFSLFCARNAMARESGDHKGNEAPSLPCSGWMVLESSDRTQSKLLPLASAAATTIIFPSGDRAKRPAELTPAMWRPPGNTIDAV